MCGHTVYCALCCVPIHEYDSWGDSYCGCDDDSDSGVDIVDKEWMGEFIIIARDPETQETFLIEQARHHEDNHYDVYDDDEVSEHGEVFDTRLVTL
ncbi:hypothetical protein BFJ63_vAg9477 [Fusarium oxysporum f. sp. narcissi]|uniref:Uncharacterized protein n=1 Tax=Fusarium oxysporum f. sp. narcissi TaxID=451672 RepID=A0A4Q2VMN2_FUSOX|nr:hypothetical protein BFJ71_g9618 [Fusarium oxysporum]RYC87756.1 hypothetical protein BFJ63_vAg9477 [Fusarium oxysporum f. sp. narcissi]